jgi:hypothetical protein
VCKEGMHHFGGAITAMATAAPWGSDRIGSVSVVVGRVGM